MGIREAGASLVLLAALSAAAGCAGDACACSFPGETHTSGTYEPGGTHRG